MSGWTTRDVLDALAALAEWLDDTGQDDALEELRDVVVLTPTGGRAATLGELIDGTPALDD